MNKHGSKKGTKTWVHPPEALLRGHIVYNVKFLGAVEVDSPKGTEIVKDAIRKMKFNKQIKKAEGEKPPKVELTISVDGVTIQEPKYKTVQHRFPLHRMSYCADDKSDKRIFSFIVKDQETNSHKCFVFDSEKCAEEITLTIGQAFDLAYKRFLEKSHKDLDFRKNYLLLQKKAQQLTNENLALKSRVADLERRIDPKVLEELDKNDKNKQQQMHPAVGRRLEGLVFEEESASQSQASTHTNGSPREKTQPLAMHASGMPILTPPPPVPNRHNVPRSPPPSQGLLDFEVDVFGQTPFTPTSQNAPPTGSAAANQNLFLMTSATQATPTKGSQQQNGADRFDMSSFTPDSHSGRYVTQSSQRNDLDRQIYGGFEHSSQQQNGADPFGMSSFTPDSHSGRYVTQSSQGNDLDRQIQQVDRDLLDLQTGFSNGLSFADDFNVTAGDF